MNATQPQPPAHLVKPVPRSTPTVLPHKQRNHRPQAFEVTAKLAVNLLLSATAIAALVQLIPYLSSQQTKLQEMQAEVKSATKRVNQAKVQFDRNLDPQQARRIMQEQANRIEPHQLQVVWTRSNPTQSPQ